MENATEKFREGRPNFRELGHKVIHRTAQTAFVRVVTYPPYYSLTSPYGQIYNKDTSLLQTFCLIPEMPKIMHSLPL